jgi:VWFA-related protein
MHNHKTVLINLTLWLAFVSTFVSGQKPAPDSEVIKVETNAVYIDALVRDRRSRKPVTNMVQEDFELLIDEKRRKLSEFHFDGRKGCPLTVMLYINLAPGGALKYLKQSKAQESLGEALANLDDEDEVAVVIADDWFAGEPKTLLAPTTDKYKAITSLIEALNTAAPHTGKPDLINRTPMTVAIAEAERIATTRPANDVALVYISDGVNALDTMDLANRKLLSQRLIRSNISFSALNFDLNSTYNAAANILNPLAYTFGMSVTGSANYFANETGGLAIKVKRSDELGSALGEIIGSYAARYSLGFYLDEDDKPGMHKVEVRVKGKVAVSAGRSIYLEK